MTEARALEVALHLCHFTDITKQSRERHLFFSMYAAQSRFSTFSRLRLCICYIYARQSAIRVYHFRDFTLKLSKKNEMDETDSSTPEQCSVQFVTAMVCATSKTLESPSGWTLCVVFFGKNGFSEKNHRQKRPPFFPVILSEKTLFPVIFAT